MPDWAASSLLALARPLDQLLPQAAGLLAGVQYALNTTGDPHSTGPSCS